MKSETPKTEPTAAQAPVLDLSAAKASLFAQAMKMKAGRPRGLEASDIEAACGLFERAVAAHHDADTASWQVTLWGGFLPNSYKWKAETDRLILRGVRTEANAVLITEATLTRSQNSKRPHGQGNLQIVHVGKHGQTQGRTVEV